MDRNPWDSLLTDSPLAFMKVCGLASIMGTSPMKPEIQVNAVRLSPIYQ